MSSSLDRLSVRRLTRITLVHKNCPRSCDICAYGELDPVSYEHVQQVVDQLLRQEYRVHLYDFEPRAESIDIYRRTRQFETRNPGWLNVTCDFEPSPGDLAYVNSLHTAIAISLHGSTPEIHRRSSGNNDHADIVRFIETYPERFILPLGINMVVSRRNLDDVDGMIDWCTSVSHLDFLELIPLGISGNALRGGRAAALQSDDKRWVRNRVVARRRDALPFALQLDALWGPDYDSDPDTVCRFFARPLRNNYCNAGVNHLAVRLNDHQVFPCPCMAGVDELAIGELDDRGRIRIEADWLQERDRIGEPCSSCDQRVRCQGGCRLTAMSDSRLEHGHYDRFAGFGDCLYNLCRSRQQP